MLTALYWCSSVTVNTIHGKGAAEMKVSDNVRKVYVAGLMYDSIYIVEKNTIYIRQEQNPTAKEDEEESI